MDIQSLKRDSAAIAEGQWVDNIDGMGDLRLRVRGWNSPKAVALRARLFRKLTAKDRDERGAAKPEAETRINCEVLHGAVLLDWDGLTDGGEPVKYDADLARRWLTDPDYRHFADAVFVAAQIVDQTRAAATEESEGN